MRCKKLSIVFLVIASCIVMGFIDVVIQPGYVIKSAVKIPLFLLFPLVYAHFDRSCNLKRLFIPQKSGLKIALISGIGVYIIIVITYFLLKETFDFSAVTTSLNTGMGVNKANFLGVALYISFANSLLEEFFFRGFAFLALKEVSSRNFAYFFSSMAFALYHIAMMIGWFGTEVIALAIIGLAVGGFIFNLFNEKSGNIYLSWLIHMFANFAVNTVGFILFGLI